MRLDRSLLWPLVALAAVIGACLVGVLLSLPTDDRGQLVRGAGQFLAPALGMVVSAVAAMIAARAAQASHKETQAQTPVIEQIQHQTNGQLTERLNASNAALLEQVGDLLTSRGIVIPGELAAAPVADPPAVVMPLVGGGLSS